MNSNFSALSALSAFSSGSRGIQRGIAGLQAEAQKIADSSIDGLEPVELAESFTKMAEHERGIQVSVAVVRRADEALGSLIDMMI